MAIDWTHLVAGGIGVTLVGLISRHEKVNLEPLFRRLAHPVLFVLPFGIAYLFFDGRGLTMWLLGTFFVGAAVYGLAGWPAVFRPTPVAPYPATAVDGHINWALPLAPTMTVAASFVVPETPMFMALRATVFVVAAFLCAGAASNENARLAVVLAIVALLFNPIVPVYLHSRPAWVALDILALGLLWAATIRLQPFVARFDAIRG